MGETLADAAKGAAAGAFLGPIGMAAGGVIGALTDVLPGLATSLFGKKGGAVAASALQIASAVTGKANPDAADIMGLPPAEQATLRLQLAQLAVQADQDQRADELDTMKATLGDVQNARGQTLALAQAKSAIAWGAPVVSTIVSLGFFITMYLAFTVPLPASGETVLNVLIGVLATSFAGVVNYWIGSSSGSAVKTEHLAASVPASSVTVSRK